MSRRFNEWWRCRKTRFQYRLYGKAFSEKCPLLALTYANDRHMDGAGAQLQRVYAIYALSRFLNLAYVHTPLHHLDYQGLGALESNTWDQTLVGRYNEIFRIPSDDVSSDVLVRDIEKISFPVLLNLRRAAVRGGKPILARFTEPYRITEVFPEAYQAIKDVSPFRRTREAGSPLRIAIHARRGDVAYIATDLSRILPNAYYLSLARNLSRMLDRLGLAYVFELHTEVPRKASSMAPADEGPRLFDPKAMGIEEFDSLPNLRKFINTDPIESIERMATADVLIISHSSFSYLPALLNVGGIVAYHRFWHRPMAEWLLVNDRGDFCEKAFLRKAAVFFR